MDAEDEVAKLILGEEEHLFKVATRLGRCRADAEDLVQDTIFRAWRARKRFQPGTSVRAWTTTILRRVFLTGAIRTKRRGMQTDTDADEPIDRAADERLNRQPAGQDALDTTWMLPHFDDKTLRAFRRIPTIYLQPFLLQNFNDLSGDECARLLGVAPGTIMSRVWRARKMLMEMIDPPIGRGRWKEPAKRSVPMMEKYAVECGGPDAEVQPGTKLASENCPQCGGRHKVAAPQTSNSSGTEKSSPPGSQPQAA